MADIRQLSEIIDRYRRFWNREATDRPIVIIRSWILPPEASVCPDDDERVLSYFEEAYRTRAVVPDDYIPMLVAEYGDGWTGALFGCRLSFGHGTSWTQPLSGGWDAVDGLSLDPDNPWLVRLRRRLSYFAERAGDRYVLGTSYPQGPADIAEKLVGMENLLTGAYDCPEKLDALLARCAEWHIEIRQAQLPFVPQYDGGRFTLWNIWQPAEGHWLSVDFATNISPDHYRDHFIRFDRKVTEGYDHCFVHLHSVADHVLEDVMALPNVRGIEFTADPTVPGPLERIGQFREILSEKCLIAEVRHTEFERLVESLDPRGLMIFCDGVETVDRAQEIMRMV